MTGWKVGFACAPPPLTQAFERAHQFLTFTTPPMLQEAVAYGLAKPAAHFDEMRTKLVRARDRLAAALQQEGFVTLQSVGTYFMGVDLSASGIALTDTDFAVRAVKECGVATIPFSAFTTDLRNPRLCACASPSRTPHSTRALKAFKSPSPAGLSQKTLALRARVASIAPDREQGMATIRITTRVMAKSERAFGPGKADLLENIAAAGSISKAAKAMDMSYSRAWQLVDAMNQSFRKPLVESTAGGKKGGGAVLTTLGKDARPVSQDGEATRRRRGSLSRRVREASEIARRAYFKTLLLVAVLMYRGRAHASQTGTWGQAWNTRRAEPI